MSITPVVHRIAVKTPPARTFELFVTHMDRWWPKGKTIGKQPHVAIVVEPRCEGRWFERDADGNETNWGKVLAWQPPSRLLLGWQINTRWGYDPELLTEVELTFAATDSGGTLVTLEHRNLERFGVDAASHAERINRGWPARLGAFAEYAAHNS
jgi:uncharacterized protein YndB with AHSA1/START domain